MAEWKEELHNPVDPHVLTREQQGRVIDGDRSCLQKPEASDGLGLGRLVRVRVRVRVGVVVRVRVRVRPELAMRAVASPARHPRLGWASGEYVLRLTP